jgi:hypothetical protein
MVRWKEYFIELSEGTEISSYTEEGQFEIYEEAETAITETEMAMAIQKTKLGKAGHNVISPVMIKYMSKVGKMISNIKKPAWKYKKMPQDCRTSVTVPIFGKEAIVYAIKIYAKTLAAKLRQKVKQHLGESQCGFCLN